MLTIYSSDFVHTKNYLVLKAKLSLSGLERTLPVEKTIVYTGTLD